MSKTIEITALAVRVARQSLLGYRHNEVSVVDRFVDKAAAMNLKPGDNVQAGEVVVEFE